MAGSRCLLRRRPCLGPDRRVPEGSRGEAGTETRLGVVELLSCAETR